MIIAAVVVIVLLVFWAISIHNNIIRASNRCDNAWAAIDTQLQRRNDLIPNLVNTVKGYAAHESKTFEAVTSARAAVANARTPEEKMQASGTLSNALTNLFAVVENYPELKANQNFLELQAELTDTENRLSYARLSYNDVVMNYNNIIAVFPNNLLAGGRSPTYKLPGYRRVRSSGTKRTVLRAVSLHFVPAQPGICIPQVPGFFVCCQASLIGPAVR